MKYDHLLKEITSFRESDLPEAVRRERDKNPEFREAFERLRAVSQLVSLKQHEQPHPAVETRIRNGIHRRINEDAAGALDESSIWELLTRPLFPALRYGIAAIFLLFVGVQIYTASHLQPVSTLSWEEEASRPAEKSPMLRFDLDALGTAAKPTLVVSSNTEPTRLQYGTQPAVPVKFDY